MNLKTIAILASLAFATASGALAATVSPNFGVDQVSTLVITAFDMQAVDSTIGTASTVDMQRYATSLGEFFAGVHLPQGALILAIELEACDQSDSGKLLAELFRVESGNVHNLAVLDTGLVETAGCQVYTLLLLPVPETVDNTINRYQIGVGNTPFDGSETFGAVRVYYQLQVSPAPATATFNDVPTSDPASQFIEALFASGITAGCGGGNFCPAPPRDAAPDGGLPVQGTRAPLAGQDRFLGRSRLAPRTRLPSCFIPGRPSLLDGRTQ